MNNDEKNFDLNQVDAYTTHLTEVNEHQRVLASEDIFNEQGVLILKKGTAICASIQDKVLQFKLLKPIEYSISIENELDTKSLIKLISEFLDDHPQLRQLHDSLNLSTHIRWLCGTINEFPIIKQKITVLSLQLESHFNRSLATAWFSTLIAKQMDLPDNQIKSAFYAGLCMEIGLLHIDPIIVNNTEDLTENHTRLIQGHTAIGWKILQGIKGMHRDVALAVFEHHERCDGSGYPKSKFLDELGLIGQIVGMACLVVDHQMSCKNKNSPLGDLLPILQVNALVHKYEVYDVAITVVRKILNQHVSILSNQSIDRFINDTLNKTESLKCWIEIVDEMISSLPVEPRNRDVRAAKQAFSYILCSIRGSGLLDDGYIDWLQQVKEDKLEYAFREVEDAGLFLDEIQVHLSHLSQFFTTRFLESESAMLSSNRTVIQGLEKIEALL